MHVKDLKKTMENYVLSVPLASVKYEKALRERGQEKTKSKSIAYAMRMIEESEVEREQVLKLLNELEMRVKEIEEKIKEEFR
ncbi:MAG: hypothetical protein J7J87_04575 [Candidatus Diapherotrites archaeon]|nr:hypothetical protein [Candidatus Diapherotrites archaeon]